MAPSAWPDPLARAGTSRAVSSVSSADTCRVSWAITAHCAHGTPSRTCRSRSSRAIASNSSARERRAKARTESSAATPTGAARCCTTPLAPIRWVIWRTRSRWAAVPRCGCTSTPAMPSPAARRAKFSGVAPRKAPEPTSGSPKASTAMPRAVHASSSSTPPRVSSWASSTSTAVTPANAPSAAAPGGADREDAAGLEDQPGGVAMGTAHPRAHLEVLGEERRHRLPRHQLVLRAEFGEPPWIDPERRALGEEGAHFGAEAGRRADRRGEERRPAPPRPRRFVFGIAVEQILDDLVFIAAGEQLRRLRDGRAPRRRARSGRRGRPPSGRAGRRSRDRRPARVGPAGAWRTAVTASARRSRRGSSPPATSDATRVDEGRGLPRAGRARPRHRPPSARARRRRADAHPAQGPRRGPCPNA